MAAEKKSVELFFKETCSSTPVENLLEPTAMQQPCGPITRCSPSTLSVNHKTSGGSFVSAPTFCQSTVLGGVNILLVNEDVTQSAVPAISEDKALTQEAPAVNLSRTILKTPKQIKIKPQINSGRHRGRHSGHRGRHRGRQSGHRGRHSGHRGRHRGRHSGHCGCHSGHLGRHRGRHRGCHCGHHRGRPKSSSRGIKVCKRLFGVRDQLQPALGDGNEEHRECVDPPGERSITGEITGSKVTADYRCSKCGAGINSFEAKDHSVKCTKCKCSWKCAKLKCTCTAEITIELPERTDQTVVLTDPLLRSIVSFEAKGHCNTDTVQEKVLLLDTIRVDFMEGLRNKVESVALNR